MQGEALGRLHYCCLLSDGWREVGWVSEGPGVVTYLTPEQQLVGAQSAPKQRGAAVVNESRRGARNWFGDPAGSSEDQVLQ